MEYRILGRTGLHVSALALGTVELGLDYGIVAPGAFGRPSEAEAQRLVHAAVDAGINLIDTARDYGESEAVLGRALRGRREQVILATKVRTGAQSLPDSTALRREMLASLETSLQQLQTDYVDLWQIHNLDAEMLARVDVLAEVFAEARQSGKVRWAGGSTYGSALPMAALQTGAFDVLQGTYSVLDQRLADRVLPMAAARNVGIVIRSICSKARSRRAATTCLTIWTGCALGRAGFGGWSTTPGSSSARSRRRSRSAWHTRRSARYW